MITQILLSQKYQPEITGLGEIYEQISVEVKRKKLTRRFKKGVLFLASNRNHSGRGVTLNSLEEKVQSEGCRILAKGFVDSPPWISRPRAKGEQSPFLRVPLVIFFSRPIFIFLVNLEFLWQGEERSHMVYVLGSKRRT